MEEAHLVQQLRACVSGVPVAVAPAERVRIGLHVRLGKAVEGALHIRLEVRDDPVDHGKGGIAVRPVVNLLLEAAEGGEPCRYAAPGIRTYPRRVAEMVVPELPPRVSRAVLGAADDAGALPGRRPVHGREHRLLLRAPSARAMGLRPDIEVFGLHAVSTEHVERTPIRPSRSVSSRAPFLPSSSCSLSGAGGRMRSRLPSGWT